MKRWTATRTKSTTALAGAAIAIALLAPAAANAGTAVSSVPNLPSGARAGGTVAVAETGLTGHVLVTQTFNGADVAATARLRQIRLSLNCGPGPSAGNPGGSGPAINNPETPCTNPDLGVFGGLSATGTGSLDCAGTTFTITAPDAQGQVDLLPNFPVYLTNGQSCDIAFTFSVLKEPAKDTFPAASGMQTTSVSAVRSEIVADPGNPAAIGLQAAGLGSGDAVLVNPPNCTNTPNAAGCTNPNCEDDPKASAACDDVKSKKASAPKMKLAAACVQNRIRASVLGTGIRKVTYLLDGRVLKVVKGKSPYRLDVSARTLSRGVHRLTASIAFKDKATPTRVMNKRLARCSAPNFTG